MKAFIPQDLGAEDRKEPTLSTNGGPRQAAPEGAETRSDQLGDGSLKEPAYAPLGHFCWPELITNDIEAAKRFYWDLFEWEAVDLPVPSGTYTLFRVNGLDVAAAHQNKPDQVTESHWNVSVAVKDADESATKAAALGGKVLTRPMDVEGLGRKAYLEDPGGARFALWQSSTHFGASLFDQLHTLCWTGLFTRDLKQADVFYRGLFEWEPEPEVENQLTPEVWWLNSTRVGGMRALTQPFNNGQPSRWMNYFAVKDCVASGRKARAAGGEVLSGPAEIPGVGLYSVIRDPAGAVFAIIRLHEK